MTLPARPLNYWYNGVGYATFDEVKIARAIHLYGSALKFGVVLDDDAMSVDAGDENGICRTDTDQAMGTWFCHHPI